MTLVLTIALAKGRVLSPTLKLLSDAGFAPSEDALKTRRLIFPDVKEDVRYLLAKPVDVPTYVEHGAADIGIVGKDVLYEAQADVHELIDLQYGVCRLVVAGFKGTDVQSVRKVATKYPHFAKEYFGGLGRQIEIIDLNGSVELAPLIGLSDCIVDVVETGQTLKENGLMPLAEVAQVSTRLVVNRRSYQLRAAEVDAVVKSVQSALTKGALA